MAVLEKEGGPFYGSKETSSLFPSPLTHWINTAGYSLLAVLLLACGYQGIQTFFLPAAPIKAELPADETSPSAELLSAAGAKPFLLYAEFFRKREVFKIYEKPAPFVAPSVAKATLAELASSLTLSGIIFEKEPQAIIEDKKSGKTYFLKKGDYLNAIKIEDIQKGKVRLRHDSETMDLEL